MGNWRRRLRGGLTRENIEQIAQLVQSHRADNLQSLEGMRKWRGSVAADLLRKAEAFTERNRDNVAAADHLARMKQLSDLRANALRRIIYTDFRDRAELRRLRDSIANTFEKFGVEDMTTEEIDAALTAVHAAMRKGDIERQDVPHWFRELASHEPAAATPVAGGIHMNSPINRKRSPDQTTQPAYDDDISGAVLEAADEIQDARACRARLAQSEIDHAAAQQEIEQLRQRVQQAERQHTEAVQRLTALQREARGEDDVVRLLAMQRHRTADDRTQQLEREVARITADMQRIQEERRLAVDELRRQEIAIERMREQLATAETQKDAALRLQTELERGLQQERARAAELEIVIRESRENFKVFQINFDEKRRESDAYHEELQQTHERLLAANERLRAQERELADCHANVERMRAAEQDVAALRRGIESEAARARADEDAMTQRLREAQEAAETCWTQSEQTQAELDRVRAQLAESRLENAQLQDSLERANERLRSAAQQRLAAAGAEDEELERLRAVEGQFADQAGELARAYTELETKDDELRRAYAMIEESRAAVENAVAEARAAVHDEMSNARAVQELRRDAIAALLADLAVLVAIGGALTADGKYPRQFVDSHNAILRLAYGMRPAVDVVDRRQRRPMAGDVFRAANFRDEDYVVAWRALVELGAERVADLQTAVSDVDVEPTATTPSEPLPNAVDIVELIHARLARQTTQTPAPVAPPPPPPPPADLVEHLRRLQASDLARELSRAVNDIRRLERAGSARPAGAMFGDVDRFLQDDFARLAAELERATPTDVDDIRAAIAGLERVRFAVQALQLMLQEMTGHIRAIVRVKPCTLSRCPRTMPVQIDGAVVRAGAVAVRPYALFDRSATQEDVFEQVRPFVQTVAHGGEVFLVAYGQTGSGKTYTMMGERTQDGKLVAQNLGIIPRAFAAIREYAARSSHATNVTFSLAAVEFYPANDSDNVGITDLLHSNPRYAASVRVPDVGSDPLARVYSNSNSEITKTRIDIGDDAQTTDFIDLVQRVRKTAATGGNTMSSRSHLVISLFYERDGANAGILHFVDLAGSERAMKQLPNKPTFLSINSMNDDQRLNRFVESVNAQRGTNYQFRNLANKKQFIQDYIREQTEGEVINHSLQLMKDLVRIWMQNTRTTVDPNAPGIVRLLFRAQNNDTRRAAAPLMRGRIMFIVNVTEEQADESERALGIVQAATASAAGDRL